MFPLTRGVLLETRSANDLFNGVFSMVILSPLIQEGQLSVSGERMYTILANHLED